MSAARLLISAGLAAEAGKFLPEIENSDEPEVLDIIATYHLALHTIEPQKKHLDKAWKATQLIIENSKTTKADKESAFKRAGSIIRSAISAVLNVAQATDVKARYIGSELKSTLPRPQSRTTVVTISTCPTRIKLISRA